jgi:hypothetical protein
MKLYFILLVGVMGRRSSVFLFSLVSNVKEKQLGKVIKKRKRHVFISTQIDDDEEEEQED